MLRDTKLDRDVALKVLPHAFTDDLDRFSQMKPNYLTATWTSTLDDAKDLHRTPLLSLGR